MTLGTCSIYQPIIFLMHVRQAIIDSEACFRCAPWCALAASATVFAISHIAFVLSLIHI